LSCMNSVQHYRRRAAAAGSSRRSGQSVPQADAAEPPSATDDLPTARSKAPTGLRIHVWCKACRHSGNADLDALIHAGKGDIPLVRLKWQCANRRSGMTDFVVTGAHFGPRRADVGKIGS
jgi:hypothetical protein